VTDLDSEGSVVKAVTFDLWETLLFDRDGSNLKRRAIRCRSLAEALGKFKMNVSAEQVELALDRTIASLVKVWDKNRDVSHLDQIRLFVRYVSKGKLVLKNEWASTISKAYISPLFEVPPFLNPDASNVLEWLTNHQKRVGIICNTGMTPGAELRRVLCDMGVAKYFHVMIFSNEVAVRKPSRRIFLLAAQALERKPREILHIGDNLKSDVWGAKNAGFKAIHLSCDAGRDMTAESDPTALVTLSRNLGSSRLRQMVPDKTISSLSMFKQAVEEIEANV
jgi:putative hydrolase of the HAD superfamily